MFSKLLPILKEILTKQQILNDFIEFLLSLKTVNFQLKRQNWFLDLWGRVLSLGFRSCLFPCSCHHHPRPCWDSWFFRCPHDFITFSSKDNMTFLGMVYPRGIYRMLIFPCYLWSMIRFLGRGCGVGLTLESQSSASWVCFLTCKMVITGLLYIFNGISM